jgi:hypothetical protein
MAPRSRSAPLLRLLGLLLAVNFRVTLTEAGRSTGSAAIPFGTAVEVPAPSSEKNWTGPEKAYNIEHNQAETDQDEEDAEAEEQDDARPYVYGMEAQKDADQDEQEEDELSIEPKSQEKNGKSAGFTWLQPPSTTNQYYWTPPEIDNDVALGSSSETDVAPRMLQACGANTANGVWSSTTPPAPCECVILRVGPLFFFFFFFLMESSPSSCFFVLYSLFQPARGLVASAAAAPIARLQEHLLQRL